MTGSFDIYDLKEAIEADTRFIKDEADLRSVLKKQLDIAKPRRGVREEYTLPFTWPSGSSDTKRVDLWLPTEKVAIELKYFGWLSQPNYANIREGFKGDMMYLRLLPPEKVEARYAVLLACYEPFWTRDFLDGAESMYGACWTDYKSFPFPEMRKDFEVFRYLAVPVPPLYL